MLSAANGYEGVMDLLISAGAKVDAQDKVSEGGREGGHIVISDTYTDWLTDWCDWLTD